jgi:hypothetical protein
MVTTDRGEGRQWPRRGDPEIAVSVATAATAGQHVRQAAATSAYCRAGLDPFSWMPDQDALWWREHVGEYHCRYIETMAAHGGWREHAGRRIRGQPGPSSGIFDSPPTTGAR